VKRPRVAIVQFAGVNCEAESARALERVGLEAEVFRWTRPAKELRDFQAYLLPGGFSYQDRVRAGALAAKHPLLDVLVAQAATGKPVLGICNGAQVLVEAGLVPGGARVELALARNRMTGRSGYYTRWVTLKVEASPCVFTKHLPAGTLLPVPMAHGEGRFTSRETGKMAALVKGGQVPLRYATPRGTLAKSFPDNPNGAEAAAAAVSNAGGNVLAIMPHPERAVSLGALSREIGGEWGERRDRAVEHGDQALEEAGPGLALFVGLQRHLEAS
jgi:phosphoribosylformylglycinamidine synthase